MHNFLFSACLALLAIDLVGCASVVSLVSNGGLAQEFTFTSEPPGVKLFLNGGLPLGVTPVTDVKIERSSNAFVVAKKEGFEDQSIRLTHHFNYWFFGNFIIGGLFGSTTDFADGAVVQLDPTSYHVTMTPKQVSLEQMQQHAKTRWARNLLLVGYPHIQADLVRGNGEYLSSIFAMLKVPAEEREQALERLRKLSVESKHAPDFAERVLHAFHWPHLYL
ncbi:MAG: hypothetical protein H8K04_13110 [Nitrospira sp.]